MQRLYHFGVDFGLLVRSKTVERYLSDMETKFSTISAYPLDDMEEDSNKMDEGLDDSVDFDY